MKNIWNFSRLMAALFSTLAVLLLTDGSVDAQSIAIENTSYTVHPMNATGWVTPVAHYGNDSYFVYIDQNLTARVGKRTASGAYSNAVLVTGVTNDPGHNNFSIAVDGDGFIHVWGNMHANTMRYWRSNQPLNITSFTAAGSEFPTGRYTYPAAATAPNGDVYMAIRNHDTGRSCELHRWNDQSNTWSKIAEFGRQSNYTCYIPRPYADSQNKLHIVWHWRQGSPGPNRHLVCYVMYNPSTGLFYNANGTQAVVPLTSTTCDQAQPLEPGETWSEEGTTSMYVAVDSNSRPIVSYRYAVDGTTSGVYQFRLAYWSGSQWVRSIISSDGNSASRSAMVYSNGNIYNYMVPTDGKLYQYRSSNGVNWTSTLITADINVTSFVAVLRGDGTHVMYHGDEQSSNILLKFVLVDDGVLPLPTTTPTPTPTNPPVMTSTPTHTPAVTSTPTPTRTPTPTTGAGGAVLFVVADAGALNASDIAIRDRLTSDGFSVTVVSDELSQTSNASGKDLIVISSTVDSINVNTKFRNVAVPALLLEAALFDDMGLTGTTDSVDYGTTQSQTQITILNSSHPLAAGLSGTVQVVTKSMRVNWGVPTASAVDIASVNGVASQKTIFSYESGVLMNGLTAPARRVGFFMFNDAAASLTAAGWSLFDASVNWLTGS